MSEFVAGFAARQQDVAQALAMAFAPSSGFAAVDPRERVGGPRHFHPADRSHNPTAGWDPLDAAAEPTPRLDPIAEAHAAGYAEGLAAATAALDAARARDEALIAGLAAALGQGRVDRETMAAQLRQTVMFLVTRIVGEVGVAADHLVARVDAATEMLADASESAMLRVHPDDVALLEGRLPTSVFAVGDAAVARGSFVMESASTVVEDGPAMWLDQLAAAMDRVPLPTTSLAGAAAAC
jgi:flagellar assembly protein FliH